MGLFNTQNNQRVVERDTWMRFYTSAHMNFMFLLVFTILNIVLQLTNSGVYFLFSAAMPTFFVDVALAFGGGFARIAVAVVFAAIVLLFYLLAFLFTKKPNLGWMIAALPILLVDTLILALSYEISSVWIDLAFHIYIIVAQVLGLLAAIHLSRLPEATEQTEASVPPTVQTEGTESDTPNSPVMRRADTAVRARVLLSTEVNGHSVLYRRVKRTNELVIDGNVYGEYTALAEMPHEMCACVDGHVYAVGLVSGFVGKSYIAVDGNVIAQKTRWF